MLPKVTFMCPTYGRFPDEGHLLEEKVYWFTRQTYSGPMELLILNDAGGQTLVCDVPGVRVVNLNHRYHSLGEKMNAMVCMAAGDVLVVDEDDDVSLPNRAVIAAEACRIHKFFDPGVRWYQEGVGGRLQYDAKNCTHHAAAYRKDAGVYYLPLRGSQDQAVSTMMRDRAYTEGDINYRRLASDAPPGFLSYVYRWSYSRSHLSARPDMDKAWDAWPAPAPGAFKIEPKMREDYETLVTEAVARHHLLSGHSSDS